MQVRTREYQAVIIDTKEHQSMIDWKIAARKNKLEPLPGGLFYRLLEHVERYFLGFTILSVPSPSFHKYENYPILAVAEKLFAESRISETARLEKIFPEHSGKTKMGTFSGIEKKVQSISIKSGEFVLILDDILTTGHTMRVSCEAVAVAGSYPCFLAIA